MTTPNPAERIQAAVAEALESLRRQNESVPASGPAAPGDLFVFDTREEIALEWLLVRFHPDDPRFALLAPTDDFPLIGTPDLALPRALVDRPLVVRCGETDWFPVGLCVANRRVGAMPEAALSLVRRSLADLARGRSIATEPPSVDFDPEYEAWIAAVARARRALLTDSGEWRL